MAWPSAPTPRQRKQLTRGLGTSDTHPCLPISGSITRFLVSPVSPWGQGFPPVAGDPAAESQTSPATHWEVFSGVGRSLLLGVVSYCRHHFWGLLRSRSTDAATLGLLLWAKSRVV